jgi:hypothetical protein
VTSKYGAYALHAGLARLHARAHVPGYPRARTHRPISNTYCFSTATVIRERASVLSYTCKALLAGSTGGFLKMVMKNRNMLKLTMYLCDF